MTEWHGRRHDRFNGTMHVSSRVDYGMKALVELAVAESSAPGSLVKVEELARRHEIPAKFLESILRGLRQAGIVASQRGADGGFRLARPADAVSVADVIRALDGPLAAVRGGPPEEVVYTGAVQPLRDVWVAMRAAVRDVLEGVTLADIVAGTLPPAVSGRLASPDAWHRRTSNP